MNKIATNNAPAAVGPYSQAIEMDGFIFTSGQLPVVPATGVMATGIEAQSEQSCINVKAVLEAAGYSMEDVIKTTCFLADMNDFATFNGIYEKYFISQPARSCVAVKDIPKGALCEIEVIAKK